MSTTLSGYTDAFAATPGSEPADDRFRKINRLLRQERKKKKRLKKEAKLLKEQLEAKRAADEKRAAEERAAEESRKKEDPTFFEKVCDAVIKAIPAVLAAATTWFLKKWFSRKEELKPA